VPPTAQGRLDDGDPDGIRVIAGRRFAFHRFEAGLFGYRHYAAPARSFIMLLVIPTSINRFPVSIEP
jgi:hypothetical protein